MRCLKMSGLTALSIVAAVSTSEAHSPKDLKSVLGDREKYFQPIDKKAPAFELQDVNGRAVRLAGFRDKVIVLHFVYTRSSRRAMLGSHLRDSAQGRHKSSKEGNKT